MTAQTTIPDHKKHCSTMWPAFVVALVAVVILVPFDPDVSVGDFTPPPYTGKYNPSPHYIVQDHYFLSKDNISCHAWLYLPAASLHDNTTVSIIPTDVSINEAEPTPEQRQLPVVIMSNGFAEQKDFGLDVYAEKFVARGIAVFLFDYRSFGPSEGVPRNWVSPRRHVEDWTAAIEHIQSTNGLAETVNPNKIGLWGVSFAGGHVLTVASQRQNDTSIVALVAQTPYLTSKASTKKSSKKRGKLGKARLVLAAVQDMARGYLGLPPVVIPILGVGGKLAMMPTTAERLETYMALHPPADKVLGGWQNQGPVRSLFELKSYNPLERVRESLPQIPVLLVSGSRDHLCPAHVIAQLHELLPRSKVISRNASHLEIIGPDHAHEVGEQMADFYAAAFQ